MASIGPATPRAKGCLGVTLSNGSLPWNPTNDATECLPPAASPHKNQVSLSLSFPKSQTRPLCAGGGREASRPEPSQGSQARRYLALCTGSRIPVWF